MSPEFLLTALVIAASPGTGVVYTLSAGLAGGFRASLIAAFGCTLGIVPHIAAAVTGLAALLHASALAFATLKYVGVAYLVYMGVRMLLDRSSLGVPEAGGRQARPARAVIVDAVAINLLNPKLTLFFFAFLPQFVAPDASGSLAAMLELSAVFMAVTFVVFALYGFAAAALRETVIARPALLAVLRRVFAGAFIALGARLALSDR
jgi:threonine/homoserine/homoserine lactone efflux protein